MPPSPWLQQRILAYFDQEPAPQPTTAELAHAVGSTPHSVRQAMMLLRQRGGERISVVRVWRKR